MKIFKRVHWNLTTIVILLLILTIPLAVYFSQKRQELRQRATAGTVSVYLSRTSNQTPLTQLNLNTDQQIQLKLYLNAGDENTINGFDVVVNPQSGIDLLTADEGTDASRFDTFLVKNRDPVTKILHFSRVISSPNPPAINGLLHLATITFKAGSEPTTGSIQLTNIITSPSQSTPLTAPASSIAYTIAVPPTEVPDTPTPPPSNTPIPPTNSPIPTPSPVPCSTIAHSGSQGVDTKDWEMGQTQGTFFLSYDMQSVPDQLEIFYGTTRIYTTGGPVSGIQQNIVIGFGPGTSTKVRVVVTANQSQTAWEYNLACPTTTTIAPTIGIAGINLALNLNLPHAQAQTKNVKVKMYNASNQEFIGTGTLNKTSSETYTSTVTVPGVASGVHTIKIKADKFLQKLVGKDNNRIAQNIIAGQTFNVPPTTFVPADTNNDNVINIQDYNNIMSCLQAGSSSCNKSSADLDDSNSVGPEDLNIFYEGARAAVGD